MLFSTAGQTTGKGSSSLTSTQALFASGTRIPEDLQSRKVEDWRGFVTAQWAESGWDGRQTDPTHRKNQLVLSVIPNNLNTALLTYIYTSDSSTQES